MEKLFFGLSVVDYPRDSFTVHFVDNGPGDGSLVEVKRQMETWRGRLPKILIHEPKKNTGFSGGNNLVMREAIAQGHDFVYLLNHDAEFEADTLKAAVASAMADERIGSVQSLIVLQQNPEEINSDGNHIHYLGFGYCGGYHKQRSEVSPELRKIAYASGAGVLYPTKVLKEVGLLDETLFAYHEDLDLGWRILLAGYKNIMNPKSVLRHRYEFSRSIAKWYWMERNRMAVVFKNYHWLTLLFLTPWLIVTDFAIFAMSLKGGWWKEKLRASWWMMRPQTWSYLLHGRDEIKKLRKVSDAFVLESFTPVIAYQEFENDLVKTIANPFWKLGYVFLKHLVRW